MKIDLNNLMREKNTDRLIIHEHKIIVSGYINGRINISGEQDLKEYLKDYFTKFLYNSILLFKSLKKGGFYQNIRVGSYYNRESEYNCVVLCEKKYIKFVKEVLFELGYAFSTSSNDINNNNNQRVLK